MNVRRASFKQSDATRALKAAVAAGLKPRGFRIEASGAIQVDLGEESPTSGKNPWDGVL